MTPVFQARLDYLLQRPIYLGHRLQGKVLRLFHYALKPTGFLVPAETVGDGGDLFTPVDRRHKVYSRRPGPAPITNDFSAYEEREHALEAVKAPIATSPADTDKRIDQLILASYTPPAVVIDAELRVLPFRGDITPYLRHPPGSANLNVTKLARGSIGAEIRKLMQSNNEELQRTNEEPTPVNDEMQGRAAAGKQRSDQFLEQRQYSDRDAGQRPVQRRFTPHAEKILNLLPSDVGRPSSDFRLKINVPDLVEL